MTKSHRGVVRGLRVAACIFAAGLVAAACSSGPPTAGRLNVSSTHVKTAQQGDPSTEAKTGDSVNPGQVLSTDSTGLAQVTYPDGSLTRLDSDTIFKVVALTANSGSRQTLGSVSGGKVWNKVNKLSRSGSFEVEAGGTTAAVRGTSFAIECSSGTDCNIISVIHTIVVTSTQTGQTATLPPTFEVNASEGVLGNTVQLTEAQLAADSWIESNLRKDGDKPFTAPPAPKPPPPPAPTPQPAALPYTPPPAPAVVQNCYIGCQPPTVIGSSITPSTAPNDGVAGTTTNDGGTSGTTGTNSGIAGLPFTGADVVQLLLIALVLIAAGWLLLIRPRKRSGDQESS